MESIIPSGAGYCLGCVVGLVVVVVVAVVVVAVVVVVLLPLITQVVVANIAEAGWLAGEQNLHSPPDNRMEIQLRPEGAPKLAPDESDKEVEMLLVRRWWWIFGLWATTTTTTSTATRVIRERRGPRRQLSSFE